MKNEEEIQGPQNQQDCPTAEAMGLTQETMGVTLAKMNRAIETLDMNQPGVDPGTFQRDFYENLSSMLTIWGGEMTSELLPARNAFAQKALSFIMIRRDEKLDYILHNMSVFQKVAWGSTAVVLKKTMDDVCVDYPEQILFLQCHIIPAP